MAVVDSGYIAIAITLLTVALTVFVVAVNTLLRYRRMSLQLKASEQHLRSIFDTALDAIITVDHTGTLRSANRAVSRLFGWTPEELVGMHMRSLMPARHVEQVEVLLANYLRTGRLTMPAGEQELGDAFLHVYLIPGEQPAIDAILKIHLVTVILGDQQRQAAGGSLQGHEGKGFIP